MSRRTNLAVIGCALALAACGDEEPEPSARTLPGVTPTATTEPTVTTTPSPTATPASTPAAAPTEEGGDEAGTRVPLLVTLAAEDIVPPALEVPAFLGLRLRVRNDSGNERVLRLDGKVVLESLPGRTETVDLEGLQPGEHLLEAGESGRATITAVRAG